MFFIVTRGPRTRSSFTREAMVRGYHIYNSIWEAYIGKELLSAGSRKCKRLNHRRRHCLRKWATWIWETRFAFEIIKEIVTHLRLVFSTELVLKI